MKFVCSLLTFACLMTATASHAAPLCGDLGDGCSDENTCGYILTVPGEAYAHRLLATDKVSTSALQSELLRELQTNEGVCVDGVTVGPNGDIQVMSLMADPSRS